MEQVDAVVVGPGARGGIVAKELTVAGLRVMLLDRGPSFRASDFGHDELFDSQERWNPHGVRFGPYRGDVQSIRPDSDKPSRVVTPSDADFSAVARCVGGGARNHQALRLAAIASLAGPTTEPGCRSHFQKAGTFR